MAAVLAAFIVQQTGANVIDDGTTSTITANLTAAMQSFAQNNGAGRFVYVGPTSEKLTPFNGNYINVNGNNYVIPSSGVFLSNTGLAASTGYFVYCGYLSQAVTGAANNGSGLIRLTVPTTAGLVSGNTVKVSSVTGTTEANGTWTYNVIDATHIDLVGSAFVNAYVSGGTAAGLYLTASIAGHSTASNGVETQTGNTALSLVGQLATNGSSQFSDSATSRLTLSWFNRQVKNGVAASSGSTASTSLVEINSAARIQFITWSDDAVLNFCAAQCTNSVASVANGTALYINSGAYQGNGAGVTLGSAYGCNIVSTYNGQLPEATIYTSTLYGNVTSGTGTFAAIQNNLFIRG